MRHQRVQIRPVAVRAPFCWRESFSAGRAKSAMPARTRAHFMTGAQKWTVLKPMGLSHILWNQPGAAAPSAVEDCHLRPADHCCRPRALLRKGPARVRRVRRVWAAAAEAVAEEKRGREARRRELVVVEAMAGGGVARKLGEETGRGVLYGFGVFLGVERFVSIVLVKFGVEVAKLGMPADEKGVEAKSEGAEEVPVEGCETGNSNEELSKEKDVLDACVEVERGGVEDWNVVEVGILVELLTSLS